MKPEIKQARKELSDFFLKKCKDSIAFIDIVIYLSLLFYIIFRYEFLLIVNAVYVIGEFMRLRKHHSEYLRYTD